jgi:predicted DNA repair protein MutK
MATGLLALLDDVAALVKMTAATLDDIPAQVAKTSSKVSGVVIDDAAVTPKYVVGLDPSRELLIIYSIAKRSLFNKVIFLGPAALVLGYFAPWAVAPILMVGGAYLCFEGYEKIHSMLVHSEEDNPTAAEFITPEALEEMRVDSAVRTDFILSAEIIAITYATVATQPLLHKALVLYSVAIAITVAVYGFVGLVVKMDDIGLYLAKHSRLAVLSALGRALVKGMPHFLKLLGLIGTLAMLWVGGEIIAHGVPALHHGLGAIQHFFPDSAFLAWLAKALACAVGGALFGGIIAKVLYLFQKHFYKSAS